MATNNPEPFLNHLPRLKQNAEQQPGTLTLVAKVMGEVGKINKVRILSPAHSEKIVNI